MKKIYLSTLLCLFFSLSIALQAQENSEQKIQLKSMDDKDYRFLQYKGFETTINFTVPVEQFTSFDLNSGAGKVIITGEDIDEVRIEAHVMVSCAGAKKAADVIKNHLDLSLTTEDEAIKLNSYFDFDERKQFSQAINPVGFFSAPVRKVNLTISVPRHLMVNVSDRSGDLYISGIHNDLKVADRSGHITLENVRGHLELRDGSGDIVITDLHQNSDRPLKIYDQSGLITMKSITGDLNLKDHSGDIWLAGIEGSIDLNDASGNLDCKNISGNLKVYDRSGDIYANTIGGSVVVDDNSGGIYLDHIESDMHVINSGSGELVVSNQKGKVSGDLKRLRVN